MNEPALMCDAYADIDPFALDCEIAAAADMWVAWPLTLAVSARQSGYPLAGALAMHREYEAQIGDSLAVGYVAAPSRSRSVRCGAICAGVRRPPSRTTAEQRHLAGVVKVYGPRRLLAGER